MLQATPQHALMQALRDLESLHGFTAPLMRSFILFSAHTKQSCKGHEVSPHAETLIELPLSAFLKSHARE